MVNFKMKIRTGFAAGDIDLTIIVQ